MALLKEKYGQTKLIIAGRGESEKTLRKLSIDLGVDINGKRKNFKLGELPINHKILDIGEETMNIYEEKIMKAKSIFWKGTAGYCERKEFSIGTKRLFNAIEKSKVFYVIAGGHSSDVLNRLDITKNKIGYISLSGGALIYLISGKKLPGLEALKKNNF